MMKTVRARPVTRGKWEATLRNIRALKRRVAHLESQMRRLSRATRR